MKQCKYKFSIFTLLSIFAINTIVLSSTNFSIESSQGSLVTISLIFILIILGLLVLVYFIRKNQHTLQLALNKEKEQYTLAIKGTKAGLWDWNLLTNAVYFAPEWKELLGYKNDELENAYDTWRNLVFTKEVEAIEKIIAETLSKKGKKFDVTFRMKHKKGHWVWILSRAQIIYSDEGEALRVIGFHTDITEQQETLIKLLKSEEKFHVLFHDSPDMHFSISAQDTTVLECNNTLLKILGYSREEFVGHSIFEFYHDSCIETAKKAFDTFQKVGTVRDIALTVLCKDGTLMPIALNANAIRDNQGKILRSISVWRDMTEIKKAEAAVQSSHIQTEGIFRSAPIGLGLIKNRVIHKVNDKILQISGYTKEEIIGQNTGIFYANEEAYCLAGDGLYNGIHKKGFSSIETQLLTKEKKLVDVLLSITPVDPDDLSLGFIFSLMDITDEKIKDKLMIVQSRHAAMGEMIGMIAHQWRQPLSIIAMAANNALIDLTLEQFSHNKAEEFAYDVLRHTEHLSKTIDDFRNFFKPDKNITKIKMPEIVDETSNILSDSLTSHGIQLQASYDSNTEIDSYPRELMQVLINIINNAKDALIEHKTVNPLIEIKVYEDRQHVHTKICDNGGGINENAFANIFDPYFTTKDEKTGTGLGLYMSKTIIEDHLHGSLKAENIGTGACFTISLQKEKNENQ